MSKTLTTKKWCRFLFDSNPFAFHFFFPCTRLWCRSLGWCILFLSCLAYSPHCSAQRNSGGKKLFVFSSWLMASHSKAGFAPHILWLSAKLFFSSAASHIAHFINEIWKIHVAMVNKKKYMNKIHSIIFLGEWKRKARRKWSTHQMRTIFFVVFDYATLINVHCCSGLCNNECAKMR